MAARQYIRLHGPGNWFFHTRHNEQQSKGFTFMKSTLRKIAVVAALSMPLAGIAAVTPAAAAPEEPAANGAPVVVPSLHEWTGGSGKLEITPTNRIVVPNELNQVGEEFSDDLAEMTGLELAVATGASKPGDISLVLTLQTSTPPAASAMTQKATSSISPRQG